MMIGMRKRKEGRVCIPYRNGMRWERKIDQKRIVKDWEEENRRGKE